MYYFLDSGPKFTGPVSPNAGGIVRDHVYFRFWISCLIPEKFAIKVGSCIKSVQILHVFGPKFFNGGPPNSWTCIIKSTHILITWQSFVAIGQGSLEILWLIKKLHMWGRAQHEAARRPTSELKYILQDCKVCKHLRGQHPLRAEI